MWFSVSTPKINLFQIKPKPKEKPNNCTCGKQNETKQNKKKNKKNGSTDIVYSSLAALASTLMIAIALK